MVNLLENRLDRPIHGGWSYSQIPQGVSSGHLQSYEWILVSRNPYDRIVSLFVNKYCKGFSENDKLRDCKNFEDFIHILSRKPHRINFHHSIPQLVPEFNKNKIGIRDFDKVIDISNLDKLYQLVM